MKSYLHSLRGAITTRFTRILLSVYAEFVTVDEEFVSEMGLSYSWASLAVAYKRRGLRVDIAYI